MPFELRLLRRVESKSDVSVVPIAVALLQQQRVESVALGDRSVNRPVDTEIQQQQLNVLQPGARSRYEGDCRLLGGNAAVRTKCGGKKRGRSEERRGGKEGRA